MKLADIIIKAAQVDLNQPPMQTPQHSPGEMAMMQGNLPPPPPPPPLPKQTDAPPVQDSSFYSGTAASSPGMGYTPPPANVKFTVDGKSYTVPRSNDGTYTVGNKKYQINSKPGAKPYVTPPPAKTTAPPPVAKTTAPPPIWDQLKKRLSPAEPAKTVYQPPLSKDPRFVNKEIKPGQSQVKPPVKQTAVKQPPASGAMTSGEFVAMENANRNPVPAAKPPPKTDLVPDATGKMTSISGMSAKDYRAKLDAEKARSAARKSQQTVKSNSARVIGMIKNSLQLPPKESPIWDSIAGAVPEIGGPILGGARSKPGHRMRGVMKGAVGGVGGGAMGAMAGESLGAVAEMVLSRIMAKKGVPPSVLQALKYTKFLGAGAGGATGIRLTTTGK